MTYIHFVNNFTEKNIDVLLMIVIRLKPCAYDQVSYIFKKNVSVRYHLDHLRSSINHQYSILNFSNIQIEDTVRTLNLFFK